MGGASREGKSTGSFHSTSYPLLQIPLANTHISGGKAKPLKSAKKASKELDEEDIAFQEKKRAGMLTQIQRRDIRESDDY